MNNLLNEYFGIESELNIESIHFLARFNEKIYIQNVSTRAICGCGQRTVCLLQKQGLTFASVKRSWAFAHHTVAHVIPTVSFCE